MDGNRRKEIKEGKFFDKKKVCTTRLYELAADYLDWQEVNNKPQTYRRAKVSITALLLHFDPNMLITDMTATKAENYKARRIKVRKLHTVNNEIVCLKGMFAKAVEWRDTTHFDDNPLKNVKKFTVKEVRKVSYSEDEALAIIATAERVHSLALACYLHTLWETGMRAEEPMTYGWSDIDLKEGTLNLLPGPETKTGEGAVIALTPELLERYRGLPRALNYPDAVFINSLGKPFKNFRNPWLKVLENVNACDPCRSNKDKNNQGKDYKELEPVDMGEGEMLHLARCNVCRQEFRIFPGIEKKWRHDFRRTFSYDMLKATGGNIPLTTSFTRHKDWRTFQKNYANDMKLDYKKQAALDLSRSRSRGKKKAATNIKGG